MNKTFMLLVGFSACVLAQSVDPAEILAEIHGNTVAPVEFAQVEKKTAEEKAEAKAVRKASRQAVRAEFIKSRKGMSKEEKKTARASRKAAVAKANKAR